MAESKHFDKIAWSVTAIMLVITILFMNGSALGIDAATNFIGYENRLFDNSKVHTIDIVMDDWDTFLTTCQNEEYSAAIVIIDGEKFSNVGIRGKGNTSLSNVSASDSNRYSFKIEFDQYDSSISYHGLDKLSLNNLIQDNTMMKDYLSYTLMNEMGVASPLCSYVYITVNGEDWGMYLAVEGIEDSFLQRNYGSDYGELYKPDSMSFGGGRGNGKDFSMDSFMNNSDDTENSSTIPQMPSMTQGGENSGGMTMPGMGGGGFGFSIDEETVRSAFEKLGIDTALLDGIDFDNITMEAMQSIMSSLDEDTMQKLMQELMGSSFGDKNMSGGKMGGMGGMGSSDVKLQYIDDNFDSYSNIWNNAKTDITEADKTRLIESLKILSEGDDISSVVDIEQVIRYFAVHNYVCNDDSYTGSMIHNYYLYEKDGVLSMIPWDYNLAFGTFMSMDASSQINSPIDTPASSDDLPMLDWIFENDEYTQAYHDAMSELVNDIDVISIINEAKALISSYVEKDPTKFCTYEEYEKGVDALIEFCTLRTQSVQGQLDGTIPSTTEGQSSDSATLIDVADLNLSDMGSMMSGGGIGGMKGDKMKNFGSFSKSENQTDNNDKEESTTEVSVGSLSVTPLSLSNLTNNNTPTPGQMPENGEMPQPGEMPEGFEMPQNGEMPEGFEMPENGQMPQRGEMPEGFTQPSANSEATTESSTQEEATTEKQTEASQNDTTESATDNSEQSDNSQFPSKGSFGNIGQMPGGTTEQSTGATEWILIGVSVIILGIGLIVAKKFKY